jgi:hypothetical protein
MRVTLPSMRRWAVSVLTLLVVLACGVGGRTAASPSPKASPSLSSSACTVEAVPGLRVRGCVIVKQGGNLDLDSGHVNVSSYDLSFSQRALNVNSGTAIANLGVTDFDNVTPQTISTANLRSDGLPFDQLRRGGVLAVRTGQNHPSKVRVDALSDTSLNLSFLTYDSWSVPLPTHSTSTPTPHSTSTPHSTTSPTTSASTNPSHSP